MIGQIGQQYFLPQGQWDFMSIVEKCPNAFVDVLQQPSVHLAKRRQIHRKWNIQYSYLSEMRN